MMQFLKQFNNCLKSYKESYSEDEDEDTLNNENENKMKSPEIF